MRRLIRWFQLSLGPHQHLEGPAVLELQPHLMDSRRQGLLGNLVGLVFRLRLEFLGNPVDLGGPVHLGHRLNLGDRVNLEVPTGPGIQNFHLHLDDLGFLDCLGDLGGLGDLEIPVRLVRLVLIVGLVALVGPANLVGLVLQ